ncbi:MAG: C1 family peptidase [Pseudobdellovibrionaceae bacterium]|nr:C1 family peptidase [Pseudobdellovibrionaceae bacterium]
MSKRKNPGWLPDKYDERDFAYKAKKTNATFPSVVDNRKRFFRAWDQGDLGSCTAQAAGAACMFLDVYDRDMPVVVPSRLFVYYATRTLEGTKHSDSGATLRNTIKAIATWGYPPEDKWPYSIEKFTVRPPEEVISLAAKERIKSYERLGRDLNQFREAINEGLPVIIGFSVYSSIDDRSVKKTGFIPVPKPGDMRDGGHAVLVVGYDDTKAALIIRNSWGEEWGEEGFGYLPYRYIEDPALSGDFWVIR